MTDDVKISPLFILYRGTPTSLPLLYFANFLSKITCILAAPHGAITFIHSRAPIPSLSQ